MNRLIAYGVLAFALYKIFWKDDYEKQNVDVKATQGSVDEKTMNFMDIGASQEENTIPVDTSIDWGYASYVENPTFFN